LFSSISLPVAFAQTYYKSPYNNFSVQIPDGWVIEDSPNAEDIVSSILSQSNKTNLFVIVPLARLCLEEDSYHSFSGTLRCPSNYVLISRFDNLHSISEFKALEQQNRSITSSDLVPLSIDKITQYVASGNSNVEIVNIGATNITNTLVNVSNSQTNQTVQTLPATHAEIRYNLTIPALNRTLGEGINTQLKSFNLFVVSNDTNTGYAITTNDRNATELAPPEPIPQIMDSFALIE
jgi:hypothetical protein